MDEFEQKIKNAMSNRSYYLITLFVVSFILILVLSLKLKQNVEVVILLIGSSILLSYLSWRSYKKKQLLYQWILNHYKESPIDVLKQIEQLREGLLLRDERVFLLEAYYLLREYIKELELKNDTC